MSQSCSAHILTLLQFQGQSRATPQLCVQSKHRLSPHLATPHT